MRFELDGPNKPRVAGVNAVVAELERLRQRDGGIHPEALVEESRPDEAPLHEEFEWDNDAAGEKYRVMQARQIVRSVVLVPEPEKGEMQLATIRAFVSVHDPVPANLLARVYRPTIEVLRSEPDAEALKSRMRRELLGMRRRYQDLLDMEGALNAALADAVEALA